MNFEQEAPPRLDALSQSLLAQTPLHFACYTGNGRLLDTLIDNTLIYNNNCGQAADACVAALISEEDSINGWTPAHWAAFYGHLICLMKLNVHQSLGFDTSCHRSNTSPLHLSAQSGSLPCLKWLLQCGSSTNRQDFMGDTALHKAAKAGNMDCAMMLVSHGASLDLKNHRGLTPADVAEQANHVTLMEQLREAEGQLQCSSMTDYQSMPHLVSSSENSLVNHFPKQPSPTYIMDTKYKETPLLSMEEEEALRKSNIFMNGEDIHNRLSTEFCDMDHTCSEIVLTENECCILSDSSWSKKRSVDEIDNDDLHSYKRRCFVSPSNKSYDGRYGDAYNNNIISSYSAVLAMQVEPVTHKSPADYADATLKPASINLQQSSAMEHEESVVAQQGYDSSFMNTIASVFH